jgi:hypothetical protein
MVTKGFLVIKSIRVSRKHRSPQSLRTQGTRIGVILPPQCDVIKESVTLRNYLIILRAKFLLYEIWAKYERLVGQGVAHPLFKHITKSALSTPLELTLSNKMRVLGLVAKIRLAKSFLTRPKAGC